MGWKDRAKPVPADAPAPSGGSWRDRAKAVEAAPPTPEITGWESAGRGALQEATLGTADEIAGGIGALGSLFSDEKLVDAYTRIRDESRAANKAAEEANPNAYLAGQVGGGLATVVLPGGAALKGAGALAKIANAAKVGGALGLASGAGHSEAETLGGFAADTIKGGVLGGTVGGAAGGFGHVASKIPGALKSGAEKLAKRAVNRGGELSDEVGRALLDEGIIGWGTGAKAIDDNLASKLSEIGRRLPSYLDKADELANATGAVKPDLAAILGKTREKAVTPFERDPLFRDSANKLGGLLDEYAGLADQYDPTKAYRNAHELRKGIDRKINFNKDPSQGEFQAGLRDFRGAASDELAEKLGQLDPELAAGFAKDSKLYSLLSQAAPGAEKGAEAAAKNLPLGLYDVATAAAMGHPGAAIASKFARSYGPQMGAKALDTLGKAGEAVGRFGNRVPAEASMTRSAATNFARMFPSLTESFGVASAEDDPPAIALGGR